MYTPNQENRNMKRLFALAISLLMLVGAVGMSSAAPAAPTKEKPIVWRMGGLYARGVSYGKMYATFAETVEQLSGGRMKIDVMYDGEGVPASEVLSAVRSGLLEIGHPFQALHAGEFPAGVVELGLPDGPQQLDQIRALFREGGWLETMREAYGSIGVMYLGENINYGTYLVTKKPINTLEDLKEMKIRCPGAYGAKLANLGASPVTMALSEVYSSLASGLLDGVDGCTLLDHYETKTYEMAKYLYKLPVANAQCLGMICNLDAYKALPEDLQLILLTAANIVGTEWETKNVVWETDALIQMQKAGLVYSPDPSPEDTTKWIEAGRKVWAEYAAKDEFCKKLIEQQTAFMKSIGYEI